MIKHFSWLRQWTLLAPWERSTLVRLGWRLVATGLALRQNDLKRFSLLLESNDQPMPIVSLPEGISGLRYAHRCAELVEVAARHGLFRANCLHKSIALCGLLRRLGLPARLRIGVLPRSRPLQAHAWVELDNNPLGTPDVGGYRAFDPRTRAHEQLVFS